MPQILVVHDDADILHLARAILEDVGYEVYEARDDRTALDLLRASAEPLVVLLDLLTPCPSGVQVLERVTTDKRLLRHAYVAWSGGWVPVPAHLAALVRWSVPKPFHIGKLLDTVADAAAFLDREEGA